MKKNNWQGKAKEDSISIVPVCDLPALTAWDKVFKEAEEKDFDPEEDAKEFCDWDITLSDGID